MINEESNGKSLASTQTRELSAFTGVSAFEGAQRIAKALASSDLVPKEYKGNLANCLVALEISQRTGASALAVMQSLHIIHGRPSWSAQYIIAALNSCGRFQPLRFNMSGEGDSRSCFAWTNDSTGERLEGPPVSIAMAKAEGWFDKNGSKWKTGMSELMLRYRAAAFFGRLYAPEILMGMHTEDEIRDVTPVDVTPKESAPQQPSIIEETNAQVKKAKAKPAAKVIEHEAPPVETETTNEGPEPLEVF